MEVQLPFGLQDGHLLHISEVSPSLACPARSPLLSFSGKPT
jgi:hypothetical protein